MPQKSLQSIGAVFGKATKAKLANVAVVGEPEDQLRAPLERLFTDLVVLTGKPEDAVALVGETHLGDLKTRPDYAVTLRNARQGFIEVKAPGKGADPRAYDGHDAEQWDKLQTLPNIIYTDGNEWSLWRYGELVGSIVRVIGDVRTSGSSLEVPSALLALVDDFITWQPDPPRDAKQLAETTARMCRLLRAEVAEQLRLKNVALTDLAHDWRKLLFPDATDDRFADGYAQAVTFGLLMARAQGIRLADGLHSAASKLRTTNSLIGSALGLLTDDTDSQNTLRTSLGTLVRVLDVVNWQKVSKGKADAWLYFYEDFLAIYDNDLRKLTGSYYTPPEVVTAMVGLVQEALVTRFHRPAGLASDKVNLIDPAVGTGTYVLGVLRQIAERVGKTDGEGAVPAAIEAALQRLFAFEMQLGPFAVAQLRILGELLTLTGRIPAEPFRMYVTDSLANPDEEIEEMGALYKPIAKSRRDANVIKKTQEITVVIGNPPYKEKAKGRGGWVEQGVAGKGAPLGDWQPPAEWGVGAHTKHLRNLYVYFWRWATWKVFDHAPSTGIVSFITVAGFLNGPGFQKMREYLRKKGDEIWVIDCSPEGHQPEVATRIFQGVQQPVCIVMVSRSKPGGDDKPASVRYRKLPAGHRDEKFAALQKIELDNDGWTDCSTDWRAPFLPAASGAWATYPALEDCFVYNGSGVMPGRTWVVAPDEGSLLRRWRALLESPSDKKGALFHPHLRGGKVGDKHVDKVVARGLGANPARTQPVSQEHGACVPPVRYAYRSFDRQWIIPDSRLINQPNPELWNAYSDSQVYVTALAQTSPRSGPALSITAHIPDLDHYKGSFGGRVFPLFGDAKATTSNVSAGLLAHLTKVYGRAVVGEDVVAYIAGLMAAPSFVTHFRDDLAQPGLRVPLTTDAKLFVEVASLVQCLTLMLSYLGLLWLGAPLREYLRLWPST
jgi:hypothetical protein